MVVVDRNPKLLPPLAIGVLVEPYGLAAPNADELHIRRVVMKNNEAVELKEDVGMNFILFKFAGCCWMIEIFE